MKLFLFGALLTFLLWASRLSDVRLWVREKFPRLWEGYLDILGFVFLVGIVSIRKSAEDAGRQPGGESRQPKAGSSWW